MFCKLDSSFENNRQVSEVGSSERKERLFDFKDESLKQVYIRGKLQRYLYSKVQTYYNYTIAKNYVTNAIFQVLSNAGDTDSYLRK